MIKVNLTKEIRFPSYDFNIITRMRPCQYKNPSDAMLMCDESMRMKTAAGYWFFEQYYHNSKIFLRFPRALPIELKGIAV